MIGFLKRFNEVDGYMYAIMAMIVTECKDIETIINLFGTDRKTEALLRKFEG